MYICIYVYIYIYVYVSFINILAYRCAAPDRESAGTAVPQCGGGRGGAR